MVQRVTEIVGDVGDDRLCASEDRPVKDGSAQWVAPSASIVRRTFHRRF